jgi:DNA-binding response OmpR family regulator
MGEVMQAQLDVVSVRRFLGMLRLATRYKRRSDIEQRIVDVMTAAPGTLFTLPDIIHVLYGDRADGGPDSADDNVRVLMHRLRNRGFNVLTQGKRGYIFRPRAPAPTPVQIPAIAA